MKPCSCVSKLLLVFALVANCVGAANAQTLSDGTDAERESLARIQYELKMLQQQVRDAAKNAPRGGRVQFRYDWLANDLELIGNSIQDHLDAPRQPRAIAPLKGDYRY